MGRTGASRVAKLFAVALVACVTVALLPGVAAASPSRRAVPPSVVATSIPHGFVDPGSTFKDSVTFSGALGPVEGTATFFLCGPAQPRNDRNVFPDGCAEGGTQIGDPVAVANGTAVSAPYTDQTKPGSAAAYCWRVEFTPATGNAYDATSFTNPTTQCVIAVLQVTLVTVSTPTGGGVAPGTPAYDTATISNELMRPPSKIIDFYLCGPDEVTPGAGCVEGGTLVGSEKTSGGVAVSPTTTDTTQPGTYCWRAEYHGGFSPPDSIAPGEHTNWTTECFTIETRREQATVVTLSSPTGSVVDPGTAVYDTATVTGVPGKPKPTGTVTFYLCGPDLVTAAGCPSGGVAVGSAELNADGVAVSPTTDDTTVTGTYCWRAVYSGDEVYEPASHTNATNECFGILEQLPIRFSRTTTLSVPTGELTVPFEDLPLVAYDTAIVTGDGVIPTGSVKFFLCGPGQGTQVSRQGCPSNGTQVGGPVTLDAAGKAISAPVSLRTSGTYCWRAEYSGDDTYQPSRHTNATTECFEFTAVQETPRLERPLPRTGTGPTGFGIGVAFLAVGFVLTGLSRRRAAGEDDDEDPADSAVGRPRGHEPASRRCRDGPRRSTGPPSRAGPDGVHA